MPNTTCPNNQQLYWYFVEETDTYSFYRIDDHAINCVRCQQRIDALKAVVPPFRGDGANPVDGFYEELWKRVEAALGQLDR